MRGIPGVLAALLLAGCAGGSVHEDDPLFQVGYGDGCASAHGAAAGPAAKLVRSKEFQGEPAYAQGWNTGFASCGGNLATIPRRGDDFGDDLVPGR